MIKSLFEEDENQPDEIKSEREETSAIDSASEAIAEPRYVEVNEAENLLDVPEATFHKPDDLEMSLSDDEIESINSFVETTGETADFSKSQLNSPENLFPETINETVNAELPVETVTEPLNYDPTVETANETVNYELPPETKTEEAQTKNSDEILFQSSAPPESFVETARKSGLAYAAAITLFGAVVFMLILGWFADLLLGSSPWGIVGGIVLGSIIGFIQFFRMTSQIFKNEK